MTRPLASMVFVLALAAPGRALAQASPTGPPPSSAPASQAQPPAAQGEFIPVSELPPTEQMPAGPLVLGAYGFIWAAVLIYVFSLARRIAGVQKELEALKRRTRS